MRCGLSILAGIMIGRWMCRRMQWRYGYYGNGSLFFKRLFCRHSWIRLGDCGEQKCEKCGLYRKFVG